MDFIPALIHIPVDGNLGEFNSTDLLSLLQLLNVPPKALLECGKQQVTGKVFADMNDETLAEMHMAMPIVMHFRDKSRAAAFKNLL